MQTSFAKSLGDALRLYTIERWVLLSFKMPGLAMSYSY
jgi:hypothetical protein